MKKMKMGKNLAMIILGFFVLAFIPVIINHLTTNDEKPELSKVVFQVS